ncbi:U3 small nucleolar RNA-associated protein [Echinococcus granulosus]|uniref:U3 small nucleolar RNA-associated protein n=1 Tax=Echinococcus granulosus TaxID=6210 RepID=W6UKB2_ECHGR|nr:U3 small nucleolar RNA-associated protein [Echinococcus granulosus]EUB61606.1 U3 small nucleolar RNA-associated protein [Echinococcus granulosus]
MASVILTLANVLTTMSIGARLVAVGHMANVPALPDANAWGLLKLKSGNKSRQSKQLKRLQNDSTPLNVPDDLRDEKKNRRIKFNLNRERLNLWKGPVHQNRLADQLIFPLQSHAVQFPTSDEAREAKQHKALEALKEDDTSLQGKLFKVLYRKTAQPVSTVNKEIEEQLKLAHKMCRKASEQMKQRLREVALLRKAKLQKRIKSKNYHRRAKRRIMKEFEKDIALLRKNNPQAFAERLLEADRLRAKERASLRHKTGGKFAKMQRLRAKYDKEARDAVANMHDQARDLTKRRQNNGDDDDSDSVISDIDLSSSEEEETDEEEVEVDDEEMKEEEEIAPYLASWWAKVENQPQKPTSTEMDEGDDIEMTNTAPAAPTILSTLASDEMLQKSATVSTNINSDAKTDEFLDPTDENFFAALQEAVGEVGGVESAEAEFEAEKRAVNEEEALKDVDTFLPGWNRWTGPGTEAVDEELRRKRLIKAPKRKRRDFGRAKVIIKERVNEELRKHLVKTIPFPYAKPEQYEQALAQPICREWTTEAAHRELTKPKVILKAGRVIKPISQDVALLREKDALRLLTGKKKV